jgi:hypothetical protein
MDAGGSRFGATAIACAGPFADDEIVNPPDPVLAFAGGTADCPLTLTTASEALDNRVASATGAL